MSLTPEQIADIAVKAALAAVQAATAGAPAAPASDLPDDKEDEARAAQTIRENEEAIKAIETMAEDILPHLMQPRHLEVFNWIMAAKRVGRAELIRQILRAEVARELPNYREWQGKGGGSTKNAATMAAMRGD